MRRVTTIATAPPAILPAMAPTFLKLESPSSLSSSFCPVSSEAEGLAANPPEAADSVDAIAGTTDSSNPMSD